MRKKNFVLAMHGIVFSLYLIINSVIEERVYSFLQDRLELPWAVAVCDLAVSAFLYVVLYNIVYFIRKRVVYAKKEVLNIQGKWYHVHIKYDENGNPKPDGLRPGKTEICQDLYEVHFSAKNQNCTLKEDGTLEWVEDERKDTEWDSWSLDWNGGDTIVTCFKASTQEQDNKDVLLDRYGIHKLKISEKGQKMKGDFSDEYPSKNKGKIYFFRTEKELYNFIKCQKENDCKE